MNGDLSRVTFNPIKHFTRVVLQQGRVQTDADGNEQTAILLHYLRMLATDLIGQHGGPEDLFDESADPKELTQRNCGFGIIAARRQGAVTNFFPSTEALNEEEKTKLRDMTNKIPLQITIGRYYVDGLLCENESYRRYSEQPYRVQPNDEEISDVTGIRLLYLDVWERHVTALDEPSIREVALGGPDTAARTKLTWQVKVAPESNLLTANVTCDSFHDIWPRMRQLLEPANRGSLRARARANEENADDEVCITSPEARFRGIENQLYRVEVHRGGPALNSTGSNREVAATFKWSRDNATVAAALKDKVGDDLIVSGLRDFSRWFRAGNWVEITHDTLELNSQPGTLVRLARVDGETLTIDPYTTSGTVYEPDPKFPNVKVRRWDHRHSEDELLEDGAILIEEGDWIELEDGIQIIFEKGTPAAQYRTGDYWLIPARVATGDVEWPQRTVPDPRDATRTIEEPKPVPPHGVEHHYAPLAAVTVDGSQVTKVVDLRHKFPALGVC